LPCSEILFVEVVKAAFNLRRKMLRNSLKGICENLPERFADKRPEQLSVADFIELATIIEDLKKE
jgi:16S rRNA (adenine1518-N6/adenine1519-N6)-dimethyltransferase